MARVTRCHAVTAIIFGVIEALLGIAIIVASFVAAAKVDNTLYSPYWAGFIYLVPGILGIITGATKNNGCMIGFMVLNIIVFVILGVGSIAMFVFLSANSVVLQDATTYCSQSGSSCYCIYQGTTQIFPSTCATLNELVAALWAVAICCLISGVVTLASSILGCASACCTAPEPTGLVIQEHVPAGYPSGFGQQPPQYQPAYPPAQAYQPPQVKSGAI